MDFEDDGSEDSDVPKKKKAKAPPKPREAGGSCRALHAQVLLVKLFFRDQFLRMLHFQVLHVRFGPRVLLLSPRRQTLVTNQCMRLLWCLLGCSTRTWCAPPCSKE